MSSLKIGMVAMVPTRQYSSAKKKCFVALAVGLLARRSKHSPPPFRFQLSARLFVYIILKVRHTIQTILSASSRTGEYRFCIPFIKILHFNTQVENIKSI